MAIPVSELQNHPRGQLQFAGSRLMTAIMGKFSLAMGTKLKHSLAQDSNGYVFGNEECSGTFDVETPESGPERDWVQEVLRGTPKSAQFIIPTMNIEITMVCSGLDLEMPLADSVKLTINWVGKIKPPVI